MSTDGYRMPSHYNPRMVRRVVRTAIAIGCVLVARPAQADQSSILVSRQLSEARGFRPGATVYLAPDTDGTRARPFRVAGIYEPTPDPMRINAAKYEVRMHLPDLLALTGNATDPLALENVDAINIALVAGEDPFVFSHDLTVRVPGIVAQPVRAAISAPLFVVLDRFHLAIALVTIVASTVFLLALTVMLVDERRETVGVLRLIGLTSRRILMQVLLEGLVIATAGALFGIVLAYASQGVINRYFQWRYDTALVFVRITPDVIGRCLAIAIPLGVVGSVTASWALLRRGAMKLVRR
jgi:putative ABC transport system permease protein